MKIFLVLIISFLAVAAQLTLLPRLAILGVAPNLVLAATIAWAIFRKDQKSDWWVLVPVLWLDILAGRPFGLLTLSVWLVFNLISWLAGFLLRKSEIISLVALSFLGCLSFFVIFYGLTQLASSFGLAAAPAIRSDLWPVTLIGTTYDALAGLVTLWLIKKSYPRLLKING